MEERVGVVGIVESGVVVLAQKEEAVDAEEVEDDDSQDEGHAQGGQIQRDRFEDVFKVLASLHDVQQQKRVQNRHEKRADRHHQVNQVVQVLPIQKYLQNHQNPRLLLDALAEVPFQHSAPGLLHFLSVRLLLHQLFVYLGHTHEAFSQTNSESLDHAVYIHDHAQKHLDIAQNYIHQIECLLFRILNDLVRHVVLLVTT